MDAACIGLTKVGAPACAIAWGAPVSDFGGVLPDRGGVSPGTTPPAFEAITPAENEVGLGMRLMSCSSGNSPASAQRLAKVSTPRVKRARANIRSRVG